MPDRLAEGLWELIQGTDIMAYNLFRRTVLSRPIVPKPERVSQVFFNCQAEQAPNPDSRITLSDSRNALGVRLPVLDWRLGELDKRTLYVPAKLLGASWRGWASGCSALSPGFWTGELMEPRTWSAATTIWEQPVWLRMSVKASSTQLPGPWPGEPLRRRKFRFPTSSNINPTLTLVALA